MSRQLIDIRLISQIIQQVFANPDTIFPQDQRRYSIEIASSCVRQGAPAVAPFVAHPNHSSSYQSSQTAVLDGGF